jgi:anaerobic magnesium-protoporphyrin IX monomethyl ester cyclase
MNNTVYLVLADTPTGRQNYLPYALLYTGGALKRAGYGVVVRHVVEKDFDDLIDEICEQKPLFAGFSAITGVHILYTAEICKKIKQKDPSIPICLGGVHASLLAQQCIEEDYFDFVIDGDGEETIVELAGALASDKEFSGIEGLGFKKPDGEVVVPRRRFLEDLSKAKADFSLVDVETYFEAFPVGKDRVLRYHSSRGCPYQCTFCYNLNYNKRRFRPHPIESVLEDIEFLKKEYKIDGIAFCDDNFHVDKRRALEILKAIDLPTISDVRMDALDETYLRQLKELKVLSLFVGVESGSERSQELVGKGYTVEYAKKVIDLLAEYHMRCHYSFIVGLPGETLEDVRDTAELMLYIREKHKEGSFTPGRYMPYPGTPLYDKAVEMGFTPPRTTEDWHVLMRSNSDNGGELPWTEVGFGLCYYMELCSELVRTRVSFVAKICSWRLRTLNFTFPIDLRIFLFMQRITRHHGVLSKIVRGMASLFHNEPAQ